MARLNAGAAPTAPSHGRNSIRSWIDTKLLPEIRSATSYGIIRMNRNFSLGFLRQTYRTKILILYASLRSPIHFTDGLLDLCEIRTRCRCKYKYLFISDKFKTYTLQKYIRIYILYSIFGLAFRTDHLFFRIVKKKKEGISRKIRRSLSHFTNCLPSRISHLPILLWYNNII